MKYQTVLLILLAATLLACNGKKQPQVAESNPATDISLMTYNVHNCIGLDGKRDYQRIAEVIRQANPDVVALQELDSVTGRNGGIYALDSLRIMTGMNAFFSAAIPYDGGSYGIGILSKEKPLSCQTVPMPGREEKRTMLIAEFKDYVFCATHQSLTPADQLASVEVIVKAVKNIHKPVFLAGDMNSAPGDAPQQKLGEHFTALTDTLLHSYPADKPTVCLDYIYSYKGNGYTFNVSRKQVIPEKEASDHRPVEVSLKIEK